MKPPAHLAGWSDAGYYGFIHSSTGLSGEFGVGGVVQVGEGVGWEGRTTSAFPFLFCFSARRKKCFPSQSFGGGASLGSHLGELVLERTWLPVSKTSFLKTCIAQC